MKKQILLVSLISTTFLAGLFYWYQVRPSQIKHSCSWVKVTEPAIPSYPMMNEEQLREKGMLRSCQSTSLELVQEVRNEILKEINVSRKRVCEDSNRKIIDEYSLARDAVPEKISWRKSTNEEYSFCLHDKGL